MSEKSISIILAVIFGLAITTGAFFGLRHHIDNTNSKVAKFDGSEVCWFDSVDENYKDNLKMGFTILDNRIYIIAQSDETHIFDVVSDHIEVVDNFIVVEGAEK